MSTVVQTTYKPQILPAVVGMIASEVGSEVGTRICEVSAGIGFGLAVGQGVGDRGAIIATSGTYNFIGVSARDVTLDRMPIDPLAPDQTLIAADTYAQYSNMAVLSRGDIWVLCYGSGDGGVKSGDPLWYDSNGHFSNITGGSASFGSVTFTSNPAVGDTLVVGASTWTWAAAITSGLQLLIGPTLGDSIRMAAATLEASADAPTELMTYRAYPPSPAGAAQGSGSNTLQYAAEVVGATVYVVTSNTTGATVTAMTAGVANSYQVVGGFWKTSCIAGQIGKISLGSQR
jgi:hypothetical protein